MSTNINQKNKQLVWGYWQSLDGVEDAGWRDGADRHLSADSRWHGPDPIGDLHGPGEFVERFWQPLRRSFSGLERHTHIFFGGRSSGRIDGSNDGRMWVCGTGLLRGKFVNDYLTIPANGAEVDIRWGEFCQVQNDAIVETYLLLDLVDLMQQAGFAVLPPSRGADGVYPPPAAGDGILHEAQDAATSEHTLAHIRRFIFEGLNSYDRSQLKSMGMADYFHRDVHWYGPGGIGACLSFKEFEDNHQRPWLAAYPDRQVQDLTALIAEGPYSGGPGWAGVKATHTGDYLDCAPTGNTIDFNGIDFWKLDNDMYIENWVFVDMVHLFRQFGIDLFERLAAQTAHRR